MKDKIIILKAHKSYLNTTYAMILIMFSTNYPQRLLGFTGDNLYCCLYYCVLQPKACLVSVLI